MRKLLAWLLIASMMLCLFACGGDEGATDNKSEESKAAETKSIDGKYMLYTMDAEGEIIDYETIKMLEMDSSYLEIKGDKFTLGLAGEEPGDGSHDAEKKQLVGPDGTALDYAIDGEKISFVIEGSKLTFVKEGSELLTSSADTSKTESSEESTESAVIDGDVCGNYMLVGESYTEGTFSEPYSPAYVVLYEDGTGLFISGSSEMDLEWTLDGEEFDGVVYGFGEMDMIGTLIDGVLEVEYGDGYYMQLEITDEDISVEGDESDSGVDSELDFDLYEGDWHGVVLFDEGTGDYENLNESTAEIIARYIVDDYGDLVPFLALALSSGKENNFENIEIEIFDDGVSEAPALLVSGELLGIELGESSFIQYENGTLIGYMSVDDGEGNGVSIYLCMRHLDEEWDEENDFPCMPDDMYDFYYGMTLEEIAVLYGYEESDLPEA